jgi:ArsR family transcriptional regulator
MKTLPVLCCGPETEPLDPDASETLAARFRALSDPTRVAIVNRLASTEECCVCDLNAAFDLSQPTISHHLKVLRDAGLVESSRRGTWAYYRLVPDAVRELRNTPEVKGPSSASRTRALQIARLVRAARRRRAVSGSRPVPSSGAVVEALEEVGIDVSGRTPKGLAREDVEGQPRRGPGCGGACPVLPGKGTSTEPADAGLCLEEVRELRAVIEQRVSSLPL